MGAFIGLFALLFFILGYKSLEYLSRIMNLLIPNMKYGDVFIDKDGNQVWIQSVDLKSKTVRYYDGTDYHEDSYLAFIRRGFRYPGINV